MSIKIPYVGKDTSSTLLVFSAAAILILLLASPLSLSYQPVQAQTTLSFRTPKPADGTTGSTDIAATLTFDVHGITTSGSTILKVTNGTFQITSKENGKILQSGSIVRGSFTDLSGGAKLSLQSIIGDPAKPLVIDTRCSTSTTNGINVYLVPSAPVGGFRGVVECSSQGGSTTTNQQESSSSSMAAGSSQDGDRDGVPDSSDRCTHNSNPKCFKEGDTTTQQQQQSSSSNSTGNQTR